MPFKDILKLNIDGNRVFGLDILRALAITLVILLHGNYILPEQIGHRLDLCLIDGVSIFFVLSGFLIGGIILRILQKGNVNPHSLYNFWTRRWLRTLPNYFLILIVLAVLNLYFIKGFHLSKVIPFFFFLQNISKPHLTFFSESWSLSVEEWFYLLIPPLLFLFTRLRKTTKSLIWLAILLILFITFLRYNRFTAEISPASKTEWSILFYYPVLTRIDSIMFGVIGAYLALNYKTFWVRYKVHCLTTGMLLFILDRVIFIYHQQYDSFYNCVLSFTILSLATLMLLPFFSELKTGKGFVYKAITYISLTSYSMYLINNSLVNEWGRNFLISFLNHAKIHLYGSMLYVVQYTFFLTATFLGSIFLYKYVELPFMRLRKKEH